jgi:FG-GAP repeat
LAAGVVAALTVSAATAQPTSTASVRPVIVDPSMALATTPAATFTGSAGEALGSSVALSANGSVALVGAPDAGPCNSSFTCHGAAFVYTKSGGGEWSPTPAAAFKGGSYENLGAFVSLSADGSVALVGAPWAGASGNGAVLVYARSSGAWSTTPAATFEVFQHEVLDGPVALSADGSVALVSGEDSKGGIALVFTKSRGLWSTTPAATFRGSSSEHFGGSVALSGDGSVALVGAPGAGSGHKGAAFVYTQSGGVWSTTPAAMITGSAGELLGWSVALSADGKVALVGAVGGAGSFRGDGAAFVYTKSGGVWSTVPAAAFDGRSEEGLGETVALSSDGNAALVGALGPDSKAGEGPAAYVCRSVGACNGTAFVYAKSGGVWSTTPTASLDGSSGESLGWSVALSADGSVALVGVPGAGSCSGAALVYTPLQGQASVPARGCS